MDPKVPIQLEGDYDAEMAVVSGSNALINLVFISGTIRVDSGPQYFIFEALHQSLWTCKADVHPSDLSNNISDSFGEHRERGLGLL